IWPFVPISFLIIFYVAAEILIPKKKILILIIYAILCLIFELSIFLDPFGNITFIEPITPGRELIDDSLTFGSPASLIGFIFTLTGFFFNGLGLLLKGIRSSGVVSRKYKQLAMGYLIINVSALLDFIGIPEIIFIVRIGSLSVVWLFYLGLREEPEKREKKEKKKEIKVEESLFRLSKRPDRITEEEVTYYKEQKLCLICKGKVGGFNTYICTKCDALYCENCARSLSNSENACWVCNEPIDKSKPSKLFKLTEETEVVDKKAKKGKKI
ncbi:MAG: DC1 domain-containing protein, partial [Candidatus Hermodarchaeota archaeon]